MKTPRFPKGTPLNDGTTTQTFPFPEGSPDKPDWISREPVASGEWDRICAALAARRALSPAWWGIIGAASAGYASLVSLSKAIQEHGQIEGADELLGSTLSTYLLACKESGVEPNPSVRLREIPSCAIDTED
jgi:phage terminase small subunit